LLLGLQRAGFRCVGVAERDKAASKTLQAHLGRRLSEPFLALGPTRGDVRKLDFADWRRRLDDEGERLDLLAGGPPCQSFSRIGRGKLNDLTAAGFLGDERNRLWRVFFRGVEELRPRAFLVENVPGMLHHGGVNVADLICAAGERLGYRTRCAILNAGSFGVPQIRERLFVIGVEGDYDPTFPMGSRVVRLGRSHIGRQGSLADGFRDPARFVGNLLRTSGANAVSVAEALGDLPDHREHLRAGFRANVPCATRAYRPGAPSDFARLMRRWPGLPRSEEVADHVCKATPRDYKTFASMSPGDRYPAALKIARRRFETAVARWHGRDKAGPKPREADYVPPYRDDNFPEKWRKLVVDAPSWTVTAHLAKDSYSHIHYDSRQARMITVREAARLQSFPDSWRFEGNLGDRFRQIGNAVPPLMAAALGRHLRLLLRRQGAARAQRDWGFVAAAGAR
jgi:DNA (cytosine-5)-methyltransferase 1